MRTETSPGFREMAEAVLRRGAQLSCKAAGKSMSPFIRNNDTVIIEPPPRTLHIGDVILFAGEGRQLILHRIVKKSVDGYLTRGDAACQDDGMVMHRAVLGRVVHVVGGLNFHLRFPLNALVVYALSLRKRPRLFSLLRKPGSLLLARLRSRDNVTSSTNIAVSD